MRGGSQVAPFGVAAIAWLLLLLLLLAAGSGQQQLHQAAAGHPELSSTTSQLGLQPNSDNNNNNNNYDDDDLDNSIGEPVDYFKVPLERQQATPNRQQADKLQPSLAPMNTLVNTAMQPPQDGAPLSSPKDQQLEGAIGRQRPELELELGGRLRQLSERLQLQERLAAQTQAKLVDMERRLANLESCECRKACRWRPTSTLSTQTTTTTTTTNSTTGQELLKLHGQVWEHECDICSCHAGQVRCMHRQCPEPRCPEPSYVAGKCCPVCHKSCVYKSQTVKHANKLVINSSSQDTCKECVCIDGRLECRRLWLARAGSRQPRRVSPDASLAGQPPEEALASAEEQEEEEEEEEEEELVDEEEAEEEEARLMSRYRRHPHTGSMAQVSICPEPECPVAEQFRLADDCCVYCRGFDFCLHKSPCHENAHCSNTDHQHHNVSLAELQQMFQCQCKRGFSGDGRLSCQDIDECSAPSQEAAATDAGSGGHICDPQTTNCVNTHGSYKCACKPGFRPHSGEQPLLQSSCMDVDECLDASLNKCHPQARCINLAGSYECRCRKGYTGDGRHCDKWFSPGPQVAAYQHRAGEPSSQQLLLLPIGQGSPEDLLRASGSVSGQSAGASPDNDDDDDQDDTNEDQHDDRDTKAHIGPTTLTTSQHLLLENVNRTPNVASKPNQPTTTTTSTQPPTSEMYQEIPFGEAPNTRTMFFHVPPRFWRTKSIKTTTPNSVDNHKQNGQPPVRQLNAPSYNIRNSSSSSSNNTSISDSKPSSKLTQSSDVSQQQQQDDRSINNSRYANHTESDTNDSLYIQEATPHTQQTSIQTTSLPLKGLSSPSIDAMEANMGQPQWNSFKQPHSALGSTNKPKGSLIIASATTSSIKSHTRYDFGPSYSRNHKPSAFQQQQQQLSQHSPTSYSAATTSTDFTSYLTISTILISLFLQSYFFIDRFYLNHIVTFYFI